MSLAATTFFEVRTTGNDLNGGAFNASRSVNGVDYAQQDAYQYAGTNLTVDATTNTDVAPDGVTPASADLGNHIQIQTGTGWTAGFYEIVNIISGKWRLDRSPGAVGTTAGVWRLGGALLSPAYAVANMTTVGLTIWVKAGTYSITESTAGVAGGLVSMASAAGSVSWNRISAYQTTHGDRGARAVLSLDGSQTGITVCSITGYCWCEGIEVDGNGIGASNNGFSLNAHSTFSRCVAHHMSGRGFYPISYGTYEQCAAYSNGSDGFYSPGGGIVIGCEAWLNGGYGFNNSFDTMADCLAYLNTSGGFLTNSFMSVQRCVAWQNSGHGFTSGGAAGTRSLRWTDCISYGNSSYGFDNNTSSNAGGATMVNCATGKNTSGRSRYVVNDINPITLSAVTDNGPFIDPANGDFRLNNDDGYGAACRAAGMFGTTPRGLVRGYADLGPLQHRDSEIIIPRRVPFFA